MLDTCFYDHFYQPTTIWPKLKENVVRLHSKYDFDLDLARAEYQKITSLFDMKPFQFQGPNGKIINRLSYRGLGLTSKVGKDSLYDALELASKSGKLDIKETFQKVSDTLSPKARKVEDLYEENFSIHTIACSDYFKNILNKFSSPFTKVRFLELKPGGMIPFHVDFPYYKAIRVHANLFSNDDVVWQVENETFKIPEDGSFYWFDTGKYHSVVNNGTTTRIVLSINLLIYNDRNNVPLRNSSEDLISILKTGSL